MSDEELIARLREGATWDDDIAAADRIEALIAERDEANKRGDAWRFRADIAEVKLVKAVEVLERCEIMLRLRGHDEVAAIAIAALAELKGESYD